MSGTLLTAPRIRELARELNLQPTKRLGQNFMVDPNTIRKIVRLGGAGKGDVVLEIGPGLGSLTIGLLQAGSDVVAVEVDERLAQRLPTTVQEYNPELGPRLRLVTADAVQPYDLTWEPSHLVANLPYNVAVPALLRALASFPSIKGGVVLVQAEVARRLAAAPGDSDYGVPSVKLAWYARAQWAGSVSARAFWPVPRVESGLVSFTCRTLQTQVARRDVFSIVDLAFSQRRKMLRSTLKDRAQATGRQIVEVLEQAGIAPTARPQELSVTDFVAVTALLNR